MGVGYRDRPGGSKRGEGPRDQGTEGPRDRGIKASDSTTPKPGPSTGWAAVPSAIGFDLMRRRAVPLAASAQSPQPCVDRFVRPRETVTDRCRRRFRALNVRCTWRGVFACRDPWPPRSRPKGAGKGQRVVQHFPIHVTPPHQPVPAARTRAQFRARSGFTELFKKAFGVAGWPVKLGEL